MPPARKWAYADKYKQSLFKINDVKAQTSALRTTGKSVTSTAQMAPISVRRWGSDVGDLFSLTYLMKCASERTFGDEFRVMLKGRPILHGRMLAPSRILEYLYREGVDTATFAPCSARVDV